MPEPEVDASTLPSATISACKKDDPAPQEFELKDGVFIVSQGAFNADNASLTYFETDDKNIIDSLFSSVNGASLGDVAQSINVRVDESYIVVNNSGLIYCIDNKNAEVRKNFRANFSSKYFNHKR